jgi:hypothetical protein
LGEAWPAGLPGRGPGGAASVVDTPAVGSAVRSVTFIVNGKSVAIDRKAPFTARIRTADLAAQLKVTAREQFAGKTTSLTKSIKRC